MRRKDPRERGTRSTSLPRQHLPKTVVVLREGDGPNALITQCEEAREKKKEGNLGYSRGVKILPLPERAPNLSITLKKSVDQKKSESARHKVTVRSSQRKPKKDA